MKEELVFICQCNCGMWNWGSFMWVMGNFIGSVYFFRLYQSLQDLGPIIWLVLWMTQGHSISLLWHFWLYSLTEIFIRTRQCKIWEAWVPIFYKIILTEPSRHKLTPWVKQEISESNPTASSMNMIKWVIFNLHGQVRWAIYPMQEVIKYPV